MPLGGYCETCGRWVWVNAYGECENGHPAAVVRDVQQLQPAERPTSPCRASCTADRRSRCGAATGGGATASGSSGPSCRPQLGRVLLHRRARPARPSGSSRGCIYLLAVVIGIGLVGAGYLRDRARRGRARPGRLGAAGLPRAAAVPRPDVRRRPGRQPAGAAAAPAEGGAGGPAGRRRRRRRPGHRRGRHERVDEIMAAAQGITRPEVRDRVARLCVTAEKILDELRKEPRQLDLARAFLTYYLEAAHRIVRGYVGLADPRRPLGRRPARRWSGRRPRSTPSRRPSTSSSPGCCSTRSSTSTARSPCSRRPCRWTDS